MQFFYGRKKAERMTLDADQEGLKMSRNFFNQIKSHPIPILSCKHSSTTVNPLVHLTSETRHLLTWAKLRWTSETRHQAGLWEKLR
ncbi:hypothetical protein AVEN_5887-1 [Araneus ventricosus]|uniref:Uncharacterized protein n=1 Tax=Araneus ventricosus TaxID=182803 RepID=A0A4Y2JRQ9_ARAVE|nr:hypothetical protein AVEN_5887-1 [Araneus ventricosus]